MNIIYDTCMCILRLLDPKDSQNIMALFLGMLTYVQRIFLRETEAT